MKKWEYKDVLISAEEIDEELNSLGEEGWELVHFLLNENPDYWDVYHCLFKRPKKD
jgi:hypothetical protein